MGEIYVMRGDKGEDVRKDQGPYRGEWGGIYIIKGDDGYHVLKEGLKGGNKDYLEGYGRGDSMLGGV